MKLIIHGPQDIGRPGMQCDKKSMAVNKWHDEKHDIQSYIVNVYLYILAVFEGK